MSINWKLLPTLMLAVATCVLALAISGCGGSDDSPSATTGSGKLVVYSGREPELVEGLYDEFEKQTGINLEVRHGESPELAATLAEEGENSPADVFYAQDAGSIGSVANAGLLEALPQNILNNVEPRNRDSGGKWVGVTGRVRVLAYNTENVTHSDLPTSVFAMTGPKWKGKLGIAPGNASFQAFVTAMRELSGETRTRSWLEDIKKNDPKIFEKNSQIVEAVARGEIDAGLVNHYYLYEIKAESPDAPVDNHFFAKTDPGNLINVSAAGILGSSKNHANAIKFFEFLQDRGQKYFATEAEEKEYPLVKSSGAKPVEGLIPLDEVGGPEVNLASFGDQLKATVRLIESVGLGAN